MASVYNDLDRPPLNEHSLQRALMLPGGFVSALRVLPEIDSTNTALLAAAADGAPHGSVVVAEEQTAGKGRLGRTWTAPARSGLFLSILVRPHVPQDRMGWLPLLAGVAAQSAVHRIAEIEVALKWPNDLIVPGGDAGAGYGAGRKLGGILCQRGPGDRRTADKFEADKPYIDQPFAADGFEPEAGGVPETAAVVVGIGLNVTLRADELPAPHATSIALAGGAVTDRDTLLRALLRDFGSCYASWAAAGGDPELSGLASAYRAACSTLGTPVRAEMPGGGVVSGKADAIDGQGRLVVLGDDGGRMPIGAGDVVHLR